MALGIRRRAIPTLAAPAVDGVRVSSLDEPTKITNGRSDQWQQSFVQPVAAAFRLKSRLPKKKVRPNLGLGLGNRDGTV